MLQSRAITRPQAQGEPQKVLNAKRIALLGDSTDDHIENVDQFILLTC